MTILVDGLTASPSGPQPGPNDGRLVAGRFRLLEPLGRGGMGRVCRALDELLARPVAVKLIYDDSIIDSDLRHACALEARAAARLNHPGHRPDPGGRQLYAALATARTAAQGAANSVLASMPPAGAPSCWVRLRQWRWLASSTGVSLLVVHSQVPRTYRTF